MNYIILIVLFIIILILFNDNTNIDNFSNTNNKYVCLYAYYEKNDIYKENLIYFLNNGILDHVDYYIIINGDSTVDIPIRNNIKIIKRENKGFDFGAWSHCIHNYIKKQYDYYIFINTSVKGPYLTEEDKQNNITWLDKFLVLFNNKDIKMVGTSINIFLTQLEKYKNNYGYDPPYTNNVFYFKLFIKSKFF